MNFEYLPDDVLNLISHKLNTKNIVTISFVSKYLLRYYLNNKYNLLRISLSNDTGLIVDNFTNKQLDILYNNRFPKYIPRKQNNNETKIFILGKEVVYRNYSKILTHNQYFICMYENKSTEIIDTINFTSIVKNDIKNIYFGEDIYLFLENDDVVILLDNKSVLVSKDIRQILVGRYFCYILHKNGFVFRTDQFKHRVLYPNKREKYNIQDITITGADSAAKIITYGLFIFILKFNGNVCYELNPNEVIIRNIIDMINIDELIYLLDRNNDIYIYGDTKKSKIREFYGLKYKRYDNLTKITKNNNIALDFFKSNKLN